MKLIDLTQERLASGKKALVPFFTAGYPDEDTFCRLVKSADMVGADLIEVGIPFSDPIADGPLIQEASQQALDNGMSLSRALALAGELSKEITAPLVVMSYYNPILSLGLDAFAKLAASRGIAGAILPDVSFEESGDARGALRDHSLVYVDLVAPTSSDDRLTTIARSATGFLYLVSVTGVTGMRTPDARDLEKFVGRVRARSTVPLYVGFGISSADQAGAATEHCDGVIIGSALIRQIRNTTPDDAVDRVRRFLKDVRVTITGPAGLKETRS